MIFQVNKYNISTTISFLEKHTYTMLDKDDELFITSGVYVYRVCIDVIIYVNKI